MVQKTFFYRDQNLSCLFWWSGKNSFCKNLAYCQKHQKRGIDFYKELLSTVCLLKFQVDGSAWHLVPSPPKQGRKLEHDHAYQLAIALKSFLSMPLYLGLQREESSKQQKHQGKGERSKLRYSLDPQMPPPKGAKFLFVDDVVTTGSSMLAAFEALGRPKHFQAFCLLYRELHSKT